MSFIPRPWACGECVARGGGGGGGGWWEVTARLQSAAECEAGCFSPIKVSKTEDIFSSRAWTPSQ